MTLLSTPEPLSLDILPDIHTKAWQQSRSLLVPCDRWSVYLNLVCSQIVLQFLEQEFEPETLYNPHLTCFPDGYALVDGSATVLNNCRLILIPTEASDRSEFRVPQEWIDIPGWVGDYYLAVEVDPDEQSLQIWGYTTHQLLKSQGQYDADDRTYSLAGEDLLQNLSVLWMMLQMASEPTRAEVPLLPNLSTTQALNLVQRLGNVAIALPRLEIPFVQWGALIEQEEYLQALCQKRQQQLKPASFNLGDWLQDRFEIEWPAIESFLGSNLEFATGFRHEDEENGQVIQRVKSIALTENLTILLLIILIVEPDERRNIRVWILPTEGTENLPENLSLTLQSTTGKVIQSVQARSQDQSIQLKRFRCPPNTQLQLHIAIDEVTITEEFLT